VKKPVLILCVAPFLTMPAFAGSLVVVDKPIVVAEGADIRVKGVGVEVGERDRHRDRRWNWYHRDRAQVVINRRHRHDRD
jgi:uncharacterized iron-regulated membrane protein